jgi:hypothetical protein
MLLALPRCLAVSLLLMTATLPSCCATWSLWNGDEAVEPVVVDETTTTAAIDCAPTADSGLMLLPAATAEGNGDGTGWRLSGHRGCEHSGPDMAAALLLAGGAAVGGAFEVTDLTAEIRREVVDGEEQVAAADLALTVVVSPAALARQLTPEELPEATRAALRTNAGRGQFPYSSADSSPAAEALRVPALDRCVALVRAADFAAVLGVRATVVVAVVAVGDRLQLATARPRPKATNEVLTLRETLLELAEARLVVEVSDGQRRRHLLLRADEAWLWASLDRGRDGGTVHRSQWHAEPVTELLAPPLRWPGKLVVREVEIEMRKGGLATWERVVLTPVTLVADLCGAWLLSQIGLDWFGCGDDDEEEDDDDGFEVDFGCARGPALADIHA